MKTCSRDMVQNYLKKTALELREKSKRNVASVKSLEEWEKRKAFVREKLIDSLGGLPEKTPLKYTEVNKLEKNGYEIENVIIESLPGIPINLNLYIPRNAQGPLPVVIFATGHGSKVGTMHLHTVIGLVNKGYAVALFDCYGRGERRYGNEHFDVGPLSWLNGSCMNRYFVQDNIKIVDYLETRGDIDSRRICCTGTSGGGNTSIYHAALDERVACVVPVCTMASFTDSIVLEYSFCPEYFPVGLLGEEIDIQDILCLIAPRPLLFIGGGRDHLSIMASMKESCDHAKIIYSLYDKVSHVDYFIDEGGEHSYNFRMRNAMYDWVDRHLAPGYTGNRTDENDHEIEDEETKGLNFLTDQGKGLIALEYDSLHKNKYLRSNGIENKEKDHKEILCKLAGIDKREPSYKILHSTTSRLGLYQVDETLLETEDEIFIPLRIRYSNPEAKNKRVVFILTDEGKDGSVEKEYFKTDPEESCIVVTADLRGIGDSKLKKTPWDDFGFCSADRIISGGSIVVGYPLIGQRLYDAICVIQYVKQAFSVESNLELVCRGHIGILGKYLELLGYGEVSFMESIFSSYEELFVKLLKAGKKTEEINFDYADLLPGIMKYSTMIQ